MIPRIVGESDNVSAYRSGNGHGDVRRQSPALLRAICFPRGLKTDVIFSVQRDRLVHSDGAACIAAGDSEPRMCSANVDCDDLCHIRYP